MKCVETSTSGLPRQSGNAVADLMIGVVAALAQRPDAVGCWARCAGKAALEAVVDAIGETPSSESAQPRYQYQR